MGNGLAYLMLVLWPAICVAFFARFSIERALIWSIVGAYLVLPPLTTFDLPLIPALDKYSISNLSALVIIVAVLGLRPALVPRHRIARVLIVMMVTGTVFTVMANGDAILFQSRVDISPITFQTGMLPGLRLIDTLSALAQLVFLLIPLLLGRAYLSSDQGLRELMFALVIAGLLYSIPALIEIRLSPQMNVWVYGFFQHSFEQMMRDGGFRPIVFLPHALWLTLFFTMAMAASVALAKDAPPATRWRYILATMYLMGIIYLCKSMASQIYMLLLLPLLICVPAKWQIRIACGFALIAVIYPVMRTLGLVPLDFIIAQIEQINPDRARSLNFRFVNEGYLLDRAAERPFFGWGGWGRNLVHVATTGEIATIADGRWILIFGTYGWFGYVSQMGLVALPLILMAWYSMTRPDVALSPMIAPLCLMLGFTLLDMLLNDTLVPMTLLMVGAILGYAERYVPQRKETPKPFAKGVLIGRQTRRKRRTVI